MQIIPIKLDGYSESVADVDAVSMIPEASTDFSAFIQLPILQSPATYPTEQILSQNKALIVSDDKTIDVAAEAVTDSLTQEMNFFVKQMDLVNPPYVGENTNGSTLTTEFISTNNSKMNDMVVNTASTELTDTLLQKSSTDMMKDSIVLNTAFIPQSKLAIAQLSEKSEVKSVASTSMTDLVSLKSVNSRSNIMKTSAVDEAKRANKIDPLEDKMLNLNTVNLAIPPVAMNSTKSVDKQFEKDSTNATSSLASLGDLINKWVAQPTHTIHEPYSTLQIPLTESFSTSYADALKKISHVELDPQIEIVPQTFGAGMKETYLANIKIYPPDLGHVLAKLKIDSKNNAELTITTENTTIKAIVEANLTQLRDNFQRADIQITSIQIDVVDPNGKDAKQNPHSEYNHALETQSMPNEVNADTTHTKVASVLSTSIIDAYI